MTTTIVSFVVVIGILILVHELGHFLVARWAGVGVERFSIGFGPVLLRWRGKETEYCLSAVPLGGYVKMMGEENPLEGGTGMPYDPRKAFALKPLWVRFLIVFAGPGMNFVLAAVIFIGVLGTVGRPVWPAAIGRVTDGSPAAEAGIQSGDVVVAVDGRQVSHWEDFERLVGESQGRTLTVTVRRDGGEVQAQVTPRRTTVRDPIFKEPRETWDVGVGPRLTPHIGSVNPGSPADRAGLQPGDAVTAVAGQPVFNPEELTREIQKRPNQTFPLTVQRDGRSLTLMVTANPVKDRNPATGEEVEVGRIGVSIVTRAVRHEPYGPIAAVGHGLERTWDMTVITLKGFWKIISGELPFSNLGGPVLIASETGRQAQEGLVPLALFTAVISVNLAVLNLLPVPMLDGGHLFFFLIEAVLGRPLSLKKREWAQQLGFVLLLLVIVLVVYNDLVRIDAFRRLGEFTFGNK